MTATRKIEVLKTLTTRRDAALVELDRAFPHGRPEGYAKGYDDRRQTWKGLEADCDRVAKEIYSLLSE